ncbi:MAG: hypothetical protein ACI9E5_001202 [Candidatus Omnitrophota bacterium]|jgi:hypothetical protein
MSLQNYITDVHTLKKSILDVLSSNQLNDAIRLYTLNFHLFSKHDADLANELSTQLLAAYKGRFRLVGKMGGTEIQWALATPDGIITPILSRTTHEGNLNDSLADLEKYPENSLDNLMKRIVAPIGELVQLVNADRIDDYYFSAPGFFAADGSLAEDQTNVANMKKGFRFDTEIPIYLKKDAGLKIQGVTVHDGTGHAFGDKSIYGPFDSNDTIYGFWVGTGIAARVSTPGRVAFTGGSEFNELHNELPHSTLWNTDQERFEILGDQTLGHRPTAAQKSNRDSLEERSSGKALSKALIEEYDRLINNVSDEFYSEALVIKEELAKLGKSTLDLDAVRALAKLKPALMVRVYRRRAYELGLGIGALLVYLVNRKWADGSTFDLSAIKIPVGGVIAQLNALGLFDEVAQGVVKELDNAGVDKSVQDLVAKNIGMSPVDDDMRELIGGLPI